MILHSLILDAVSYCKTIEIAYRINYAKVGLTMKVRLNSFALWI